MNTDLVRAGGREERRSEELGLLEVVAGNAAIRGGRVLLWWHDVVEGELEGAQWCFRMLGVVSRCVCWCREKEEKVQRNQK